MGKGEIARYEQFLLFPQCFQKACFPGVSKDVNVWEWVNMLLLVIYLSVIGTHTCHREMGLTGSNSFGFAENTVHDFENTVLKS